MFCAPPQEDGCLIPCSLVSAVLWDSVLKSKVYTESGENEAGGTEHERET